LTINKSIAPIYIGSSGTGLVVHVGGGLTTVAPVIEKECPTEQIVVNKCSGGQITGHLRALLERDGIIRLGSTTAQIEILREIKEKVAIVAS
jgi:actin-related protein